MPTPDCTCPPVAEPLTAHLADSELTARGCAVHRSTAPAGPPAVPLNDNQALAALIQAAFAAPHPTQGE